MICEWRKESDSWDGIIGKQTAIIVLVLMMAEWRKTDLNTAHTAAAWYLERKYRNRWGQRSEIEHKGNVEINIKVEGV